MGLRRKLKRNIRKIRFQVGGGTRFEQDFRSEALVKSLAGFQSQSDISDHVSSLFYHALAAQPKLIVELGTRGGESTRVLLAVAELTGAKMLSVDIHDCSNLNLALGTQWEFVQADDVAFADRFPTWCAERGIIARADVLFLDTSHLYEHTKRELAAWIPHLADDGTLILHDTNMGKGVYARLDGSLGIGWNNDRGVIRAVEEYLGTTYREDRFFTDVRNGFLVLHFPHSNGLTILKRIPESHYPAAQLAAIDA